MYTEFFGFRERPFQLLPNPDYLFLSQSHEEALGHLLYAVSHGEGFAAISGEVGTGKTTLCRALLESLGDEVQAAYIFHPKLDPLELLQAVAAEFGIPHGADSTREMIDILHRFLISKKEERKRILLIIDEAQDLSADVLEQVRLLSNLETTTSKLVQIVLVGQPELDELLASRDLRQLRQRISLRCRLRPLTERETGQYIRHRLRQAGGEGKDGLFTPAAVRAVHRYAGGIPRLVNIACDRALLLAYGADRSAIAAGTARKAVRELQEAASPRRWRASATARTALAALLAVAVFLGLESLLGPGGEEPALEQGQPAPALLPAAAVQPAALQPEPGVSADRTGEPAAAEAPTGAGLASEARSLDDLLAFVGSPHPYGNRDRALESAVQRWQTEASYHTRFSFLHDDLTFFRLNAQTAGLSVTPVSGGAALLHSLNTPAILELAGPRDQGPKYLVLTRISEDLYRLEGLAAGECFEVSAGDLYRVWTGRAYLVWRNFLGLDGVIPLNSSLEAIVSLKLLLSEMGVRDLDTGPEYDESTRQAVLAVQRQHGIFVDGLVGPLTLIVLYNLAGSFPIPRLIQEGPEAPAPVATPDGPSEGGEVP